MRRALLAQWTAQARPLLLAGVVGALVLATGLAAVTGEVGDAAPLVGAIALALGASVVAGAFSGGTIRNLLVREPRRLRLLAGTWAAVAGLVAAAAALAVPIATGLAFAAARARGIETAEGFGAMLEAMVAITASAVGFATLGAALGALLRSPGLAVGAGLVWVLPLEGIPAAAWDEADRVLPGRLLAAVAEGGAEVGLVAAAAGAALWAAGLALAAGAAFARRDVVS